jgi:hypothetical protein
VIGPFRSPRRIQAPRNQIQDERGKQKHTTKKNQSGRRGYTNQAKRIDGAWCLSWLALGYCGLGCFGYTCVHTPRCFHITYIYSDERSPRCCKLSFPRFSVSGLDVDERITRERYLRIYLTSPPSSSSLPSQPSIQSSFHFLIPFPPPHRIAHRLTSLPFPSPSPSPPPPPPHPPPHLLHRHHNDRIRLLTRRLRPVHAYPKPRLKLGLAHKSPFSAIL